MAKKNGNTTEEPLEKQLWKIADKLRKNTDEAMDAIEKENSSLKSVLPKVFARQNLDPTSLGELIDLIGNHYRPIKNQNSYFKTITV